MNLNTKEWIIAAGITLSVAISMGATAGDYFEDFVEIDAVAGTGADLYLCAPGNECWGVYTSSGEGNEFKVYDYTFGKRPFSIEQNTPDNTLVLTSSGSIGSGTTTPDQELHIVSSNFPFIHIENTGTTNTGIQLTNPSTVGNSRLLLLDTSGNFYFYNNGGSGGAALTWEHNTDYIGIGTENPERKLHVVENGVGETVPFYLSNADGKVRFLLTAKGQSWTFDNTGTNTFAISRIGTGVNELELSGNGNLTIQGILTQGSSHAIKQDIEAVSADSMLKKVIALPIAEWSYKHDGDGVRHVGPMSEDFYQAFGLGNTDKGLTSIDTSGVALAAIQGLNAKLTGKDAEIAALRDTVARQEERMLQMEMALAELLRNQTEAVQVSGVN